MLNSFDDVYLPICDLDYWALSDDPQNGLTFRWKGLDGHDYMIYSTNGITFQNIFQNWKGHDFSHFVLECDGRRLIEDGNARRLLLNTFCSKHVIYNYEWVNNNISIRDDELRNYKSQFTAHIVHKNGKTTYSIQVNMKRTIEPE